MYKKVLLFVILFFMVYILGADELADHLQDLAIQTACLGMYSSTEAGRDFINRYNDPHDWYTPPMMANRFARMSGSMTRTITFYGICFDYAQFAWEDIKRYQSLYNNAGMKGSEWYIAVTFHGDPNTIILYDPVTPEKATRILNGIPVKEASRHRIRAHDNATGHAWIWVQHKNGTWYWIDPTWTDNTGYPWWGIVQDGREVQYYPNPNYSIASNFPRPPSPNETQAEKKTRSPNSTYVTYRGNPTYYTGNYDPSQSQYLMIGYNYVYGLPIGFTIADSMFLEKSLIYISGNFWFDSFETEEGNVNYNSYRRTKWSQIIIEWIYGVSIALSENFRIPIGIGGNHVLLSPGGFSSSNFKRPESEEKWEHSFVLEVGAQPVLFKKIALTATYRLKGFSESGFSIGAGILF